MKSFVNHPQLQSYSALLANLNLNGDESTTYLACLANSESSATTISRTTGLKRPTTYLILERLEKSGLVFCRKLNNRRVYRALPPSALVEEKRQSLKEFESALPGLNSFLSTVSSHAQVTQLFGRAGLEEYYRDCYATDSDVLTWFDQSLCAGLDTPEPWVEARFGLANLQKSSKRSKRASERIRRKNWIRGIVPYESNDNRLSKTGLLSYQNEFLHYKKFGLHGEYRDFVLVPRSEFLLPFEISIYGDKVAFVSYMTLSVTVIRDRDLSASLASIFNICFSTFKMREPSVISAKHREFLEA